MSVGEKLIRATQWQPLDGSASNAIPKWTVIAGTQTQKLQIPVVSFDGAGTTIQYACYSTRVPSDYAAGGTLKLLWMTAGTSSTVKWQVATSYVTPDDADTPLEHVWGTTNFASAGANATEARRLTETSISLLDFSTVAAGDMISFLLSRDPANDTCTSDAELISAAFQYTADDQAGSPLGIIGLASVTSPQTGITSVTDLTGLTETINALGSRYVKLTAEVGVGSTVSTDVIRLSIKEGGTTLSLADRVPGATDSVSNALRLGCHVIITPSAGSHTYKLTLDRVSGSGTLQMGAGVGFPAFILVEDIGAV